ncbi:hypothetical protein D3C87_1677540 [compost metagenome]
MFLIMVPPASVWRLVSVLIACHRIWAISQPSTVRLSLTRSTPVLLELTILRPLILT